MHIQQSSSPFPFDQLFFSFFSLPVSDSNAPFRIQMIHSLQESIKTIVAKKTIGSVSSNQWRMKSVSVTGTKSEELHVDFTSMVKQPMNQARIQSVYTLGSKRKHSSYLYSNVIDQLDGDLLFQLLMDYLAFQAREVSIDVYMDRVLHHLIKLGLKDQAPRHYAIEEAKEWFTLMGVEAHAIDALKQMQDQSKMRFQDVFDLLLRIFLLDETKKVIQNEKRTIMLKNRENTTIFYESYFEFLTKNERLGMDADFSAESWFVARFHDVLRFLLDVQEIELKDISFQEQVYQSFVFHVSQLLHIRYEDQAFATLFLECFDAYQKERHLKSYGYLLYELESAWHYSFLKDAVYLKNKESFFAELTTYGIELFRKGYRTIQDQIERISIEKNQINEWILSLQSTCLYYASKWIGYEDSFMLLVFESYQKQSQQTNEKEMHLINQWEQFLLRFSTYASLIEPLIISSHATDVHLLLNELKKQKEDVSLLFENESMQAISNSFSIFLEHHALTAQGQTLISANFDWINQEQEAIYLHDQIQQVVSNWNLFSDACSAYVHEMQHIDHPFLTKNEQWQSDFIEQIAIWQHHLHEFETQWMHYSELIVSFPKIETKMQNESGLIEYKDSYQTKINDLTLINEQFFFIHREYELLKKSYTESIFHALGIALHDSILIKTQHQTAFDSYDIHGIESQQLFKQFQSMIQLFLFSVHEMNHLIVQKQQAEDAIVFEFSEQSSIEKQVQTQNESQLIQIGHHIQLIQSFYLLALSQDEMASHESVNNWLNRLFLFVQEYIEMPKSIQVIHEELHALMTELLIFLMDQTTWNELIESKIKEIIAKDYAFYEHNSFLFRAESTNASMEQQKEELYQQQINDQTCFYYETFDYYYPIGQFQLGEHTLR